MKAFAVLIWACIIISVLITALPTFAYSEPSVGVKKGDWIEYTITITGPALTPSRNLTWFRNDILEVNGASFKANMTVLAVNGNFSSSIWIFNLTEGQVQGWQIIPANLTVGDTFFDVAKDANITVDGQEQKIVAGASRTIIHANDPGLYKEWDKATGVYVDSSEYTKNYTVVTSAIATNMWSSQNLEQNQTSFYLMIEVSIVLAVIFASAIVVAQRKRLKRSTWHLSQRKIVVLTILSVVFAEIGFTWFFPFYAVGLNFAQINLIMQTIWTALVFVSLGFRLKRNYFLHEITMLIVISAWIVGLSAVLMMGPLSSTSSQILSNTPVRLIMNSLHGIISVPALALGLWLVLLWRPESISFAAKSKRIAQLLPFFWILSYAVGVLDFMLLHTSFLG